MAPTDSLSADQLAETIRTVTMIHQRDSVVNTASFDTPTHLLLPVFHQDAFTVFLLSKWGMPIFLGAIVLVFVLIAWALVRSQARAAAMAATRTARAAADSADMEQLRALYDHLLGILWKRDRYMIQYQAVVNLSKQQFTAWDHANWKAIARNQLAMTEAVRPVIYDDYRGRIRSLSPTYGNLPGPALQAWADSGRVPLMEEVRFLAEETVTRTGEIPSKTLEETLAELVALFGDDDLESEEETSAVAASIQPLSLPSTESVADYIAQVRHRHQQKKNVNTQS